MKTLALVVLIGWAMVVAIQYKIVEIELIPNDVHVIINKPAWLTPRSS